MSDNNNNESHISEESVTSAIKNSNFNCFASLSDYKNIKINMLNISKLTYNNMIIQYNNLLTNVKTDFDRNSARFFINY